MKHEGQHSVLISIKACLRIKIICVILNWAILSVRGIKVCEGSLGMGEKKFDKHVVFVQANSIPPDFDQTMWNIFLWEHLSYHQPLIFCFREAFLKAFSLLKNSSNPQCQRFIIFVTDGQNQDYGQRCSAGQWKNVCFIFPPHSISFLVCCSNNRREGTWK